jgi:hypothetical protein
MPRHRTNVNCRTGSLEKIKNSVGINVEVECSGGNPDQVAATWSNN